ncbi:MAG TPA: cupin domain-containing protein [Candidatus Polarisedimenticolaceae bacterium]|nr:cupin domain-containing protein [Candidatus Polarisedimenticolaceae bacterium]
MDQRLRGLFGIVGFSLLLGGCAKESTPAPAEPAMEVKEEKKVLPPEPTVTHTAANAQAGEKIEHGELLLEPDENTKKLNAQHHAYKVLETRRVPGPITKPEMKEIKDFALSKSELDVINPGPGEYVHVMEGQRHGYQNLTIGITYTAPGGAPPMHTHKGEESHVLLTGQKILYALGDKIFVKEGPYMVNIPPGVPHSFQNLDDDVAELVVIFPTNVWEYDVLDYFPFNTPEAKAMAAEAKGTSAPTQ